MDWDLRCPQKKMSESELDVKPRKLGEGWRRERTGDGMFIELRLGRRDDGLRNGRCIAAAGTLSGRSDSSQRPDTVVSANS